MVSLLIDKSSLHNKSTKLYNNIKLFTSYLNNNELYKIFILGYYLCKYTLIEDKKIINTCNKEKVINFINNKIYTDNDKHIAQRIINYMDTNRRKYQKKLCDSILNNVIYDN